MCLHCSSITSVDLETGSDKSRTRKSSLPAGRPIRMLSCDISVLFLESSPVMLLISCIMTWETKVQGWSHRWGETFKKYSTAKGKIYEVSDQIPTPSHQAMFAALQSLLNTNDKLLWGGNHHPPLPHTQTHTPVCMTTQLSQFHRFSPHHYFFCLAWGVVTRLPRTKGHTTRPFVSEESQTSCSGLQTIFLLLQNKTKTKNWRIMGKSPPCSSTSFSLLAWVQLVGRASGIVFWNSPTWLDYLCPHAVWTVCSAWIHQQHQQQQHAKSH